MLTNIVSFKLFAFGLLVRCRSRAVVILFFLIRADLRGFLCGLGCQLGSPIVELPCFGDGLPLI